MKAERTRDVGEPIELKGKVIQMIIRGDDAWTAESGAVARRIDLTVRSCSLTTRPHFAIVSES